MTKQDLSKLFAFVTALYPNITVKQGTLEAWYQMIGDLPADVAKAAFMKVLSVQTIPCMPAVGSVREAALSLTGNTPPLPAIAWHQAREASMARSFDTTTLHPAVQKAIRGMGGLEAMGLDESPLGMRQARFLKLYEPVAVHEQAQGVLPEAVRAFIGGSEVKRIGGAVK
jgi:hypothetical protein